jgi:hypothetical protein
MNSKFTYYCYLYFDPTTDQAIYIGKGHANRAFEHLKRKDKHYFVRKIQKLVREGHEPVIKAKTGLTEEQAFMYEKLLIAVFGRHDLGTGTLLNLTNGGENPPKGIKKTSFKKGHKPNGNSFKKGHVPYNAGTKGISKGKPPIGVKRNAFKKGQPNPMAKQLAICPHCHFVGYKNGMGNHKKHCKKNPANENK